MGNHCCAAKGASPSPAAVAANLPPLKPVENCNTHNFMGTWFVVGVKPTIFEKTCSNAVEHYKFLLMNTDDDCGKNKNNEGKMFFNSNNAKTTVSHDIDIDFQYNKAAPMTSPLKKLPQKGWVSGNPNNSGTWQVSLFWPIKMPYLILEVDDVHYSYAVIGYPSRDYCWIMYRHPVMPPHIYDTLVERLKTKHHYDLTTLRTVPQVWTREERQKRGLTPNEIPDHMLVDHQQQADPVKSSPNTQNNQQSQTPTSEDQDVKQQLLSSFATIVAEESN